MSKLFLYAFFLGCFFLKNSYISAQNAENIKMNALFDMVSSPQREGKELLLKKFEDGIMPINDLGIELLTRLAGIGSFFQDKTPGDLSDIRIRALSVLGTAGASGAQAITTLLRTETDPNAMAISFYYLGEAGPADDERIAAMTIAMRKDIVTKNNNNTALFYLDAIRKVVTIESAQLPHVIDLLSFMLTAPYSRKIQKDALDSISHLTRG